MSLETQSESQEEMFGSWFITAQGKYILDPDLMPPGLYDIVKTYSYICSSAAIEEECAAAHMDAAPKFREITGFELDDFLKFRTRLNRAR